MSHSRYHEEAIEFTSLLVTADFFGHGVKVIDVVLRRDGSVTPAYILDQLAAMRLEGTKIGINGIQDCSGPDVRLVSILSDAESVRSPPGVWKHDVLEIAVPEQSLQSMGRI